MVKHILDVIVKLWNTLTRLMTCNLLSTRRSSALRRGENADRLKRILANMQLSKSDILEGDVVEIDEFRFLDML